MNAAMLKVYLRSRKIVDGAMSWMTFKKIISGIMLKLSLSYIYDELNLSNVKCDYRSYPGVTLSNLEQ